MLQLEFHKYFMFPVSNYENFDKDCSTNKSEEIMWQFSASEEFPHFVQCDRRNSGNSHLLGHLAKLLDDTWHHPMWFNVFLSWATQLLQSDIKYNITHILHYLFGVGDYYFVWVKQWSYDEHMNFEACPMFIVGKCKFFCVFTRAGTMSGTKMRPGYTTRPKDMFIKEC